MTSDDIVSRVLEVLAARPGGTVSLTQASTDSANGCLKGFEWWCVQRTLRSMVRSGAIVETRHGFYRLKEISVAA